MEAGGSEGTRRGSTPCIGAGVMQALQQVRHVVAEVVVSIARVVLVAMGVGEFF